MGQGPGHGAERGRDRGRAAWRGDGHRPRGARHRDSPGGFGRVGDVHGHRPGHHQARRGRVARGRACTCTTAPSSRRSSATPPGGCAPWPPPTARSPPTWRSSPPTRWPTPRWPRRRGSSSGCPAASSWTPGCRPRRPACSPAATSWRSRTGCRTCRSRDCPAATPTPRARWPASAPPAACATTARCTCRGAWSPASRCSAACRSARPWPPRWASATSRAARPASPAPATTQASSR